MKYLIVLAIGAVVGAFGMKYHDDAKFASLVNAKADTAIAQGASTAHNALVGAADATK